MTEEIKFKLSSEDSSILSKVFGPVNANINQIQDSLGIKVKSRGNSFSLVGKTEAIKAGKEVIETLHLKAEKSELITPGEVHLFIRKAQSTGETFGIGPAGTGKTFLAVAVAVSELMLNKVQKIILARPAVEAGEHLGFLPGDLSQKVDPYLKPLYDALYEMIGPERVNKLLERGIIELAPLAYMRGRTLNNSYIILDEAQNCTKSQMKMFLTRIGFGSSAIVTGDITQTDLPKGSKSGLLDAIEVLEGEKNISFSRFQSKDVVRHGLVQRIIEAYDSHEKE
jgi:phosphate starvation-inducible PhoH-like protein